MNGLNETDDPLWKWQNGVIDTTGPPENSDFLATAVEKPTFHVPPAQRTWAHLKSALHKGSTHDNFL